MSCEKKQKIERSRPLLYFLMFEFISTKNNSFFSNISMFSVANLQFFCKYSRLQDIAGLISFTNVSLIMKAKSHSSIKINEMDGLSAN